MSEQDRKGAASFTLEIDQQIIEGFLVDQETTLRELAKAGFSRSEVLGRAGKLGLTPGFLKRHRVDPLDLLVRRCLNCDEAFLSTGPQNRLCNRCCKRQ